jgi:hypothetical protein
VYKFGDVLSNFFILDDDIKQLKKKFRNKKKNINIFRGKTKIITFRGTTRNAYVLRTRVKWFVQMLISIKIKLTKINGMFCREKQI